MRIAIPLLVVGLLGSVACSNSGTRVTSAASLTDSDLKHMVESKLATDPQLTQIDVNADAARNQVTLSGSAPSAQARDEAVDMAKSANSNPNVVDNIEVKQQELSRNDYTDDMARETREKAEAVGDKIGQSADDAWIYTKIEAKLATNSTTPAHKINVDVSKKVVTLRGNVDSSVAKQEAGRIAQETDGVKQVRNLLKVAS
jgi:hyperosmotically inducible periplasmic protein